MRARVSGFSVRLGLLVVLIAMVVLAPAASASVSAQDDTPAIIPAGVSAGDPEDVRLLQSDPGQIVLQVGARDHATGTASAAGSTCQQLQVPGYVLSEEAGRPQLPYKVLLLGVPPGAEVQVEAEALETEQLSGDLLPCAAPKATPRLDAEGRILEVVEEPALDAAVFGADRLYPTNLARVVDLGYMRSQHIVRLEITPVQVNPVTGEGQFHKQMRVTVRFHGGAETGVPVAEPAEFENAFRNMLLNYESARAWRSSTASAAASMAAWTPPTPGYKIAVKDPGLYELTYAALSSAGLPVDTLNPATLRLFSSGQEVAIRVLDGGNGRLDPGDSVLFFGQGVSTRYTATNIYWLTYGGANGKRIVDRASAAGGSVPTEFRSVVRNERNLFYVSTLPMDPGYEHWYGPRIQVSGAGASSGTDFTVNVVDPAATAATATLNVLLAGNTTGAHHVRALVGGQQVMDRTWSDRTFGGDGQFSTELSDQR